VRIDEFTNKKSKEKQTGKEQELRIVDEPGNAATARSKTRQVQKMWLTIGYRGRGRSRPIERTGINEAIKIVTAT